MENKLTPEQIEEGKKFDDSQKELFNVYMRAYKDPVQAFEMVKLSGGPTEKTPEKKPILKEFAKDVAKSAVGSLVVRPADRATEAITRLIAPNSLAAQGYQDMADKGESRNFGGIEVKNTKAFGQGGASQIIGEGLEAGSWLAGGGAGSKLLTKGLGTVGGLAAEGAIIGGAGGAGNALQAENPTGLDVIKQTLIGAGLGTLLGGGVGLVSKAVSPAVAKIGSSAAEKGTSKFSKLSDYFNKVNNKKSTMKTVEEVFQGKEGDLKNELITLGNIDKSKIKTYQDLKNEISRSKNDLIAKQDAILSKDTTKIPLSELNVAQKAKSGAIVNTNYVERALNDLDELYTKIGDDVAHKDITDLIRKAKTIGLTRQEINQIARDYSSEFGSKAFSKAGDPLTSVNAQKFENTRKGVKILARTGEEGGESALLDRKISAMIRSEKLADRMVESVNKIQNRIKNRGLLEKAGHLITKGLDMVSGGFIRGAVGGLLPRGVGNKVMNALDLEEALAKNLAKFEKAMKEGNDEKFLQELKDMFKTPKKKAENPVKGVNNPKFLEREGVNMKNLDVPKLPSRDAKIELKRANELDKRHKLEGGKNKIVEKIITPEGNRAHGVYRAGDTYFEKNVMQFTAEHEFVHKIVRNIDNIPEFKGFKVSELLDEIRAKYKKPNLSWNDAEEQLAIDIQKYARLKELNKPTGFVGKLKDFLERTYQWLKRSFSSKKDINEFYRIITEGKAKTATKLRTQEATNFFNKKLKEGVADFRNMDVVSALEKEIPNVFTDSGDLTLKTITRLEGKNVVSKQYISDLTNSGDIKQVERDLIRQMLEGEGDKVNVKQFVDKVKAELLPLKVEGTSGLPDGRNANALYENISLPSELRGKVANYGEKIYSSPVKTSAGSVHFGKRQGALNADNYFGHTRIEDMADNKTRRVIEVQSDLYQKGNLENEANKLINRMTDVERKEYEKLSSFRENGEGTLAQRDAAWKRMEELRDEAAKRSGEVNKQLAQYNNPTAHFRMLREEIKKAAQDGKKDLLIPTGETAMKIEGLGENPRQWTHADTGGQVVYNTLEVGQTLQQGNRAMGADEWIITDVLGDGKFKAVPKRLSGTAEDMNKFIESGQFDKVENFKETFDISGKVDTNNPIYKFYEKELSNYVKNNYDAVPFTDEKGVTWMKVPIKKEYAELPVPAFNRKLSDFNFRSAAAKMDTVDRNILTEVADLYGKGKKVSPELWQKAQVILDGANTPNSAGTNRQVYEDILNLLDADRQNTKSQIKKKLASVKKQLEELDTKNPDYAIGGGSGHTAPIRDGFNAPAFDLTRLYPEDIYEKGAKYYGSGYPELDNQVMNILLKVKGKPSSQITIYRAVPLNIDTINAGDWVSLSKEYAKIHGESNLKNKYKILSKKVRADEVFTDANSLQEFGYDPKRK